MKVYMLKCVSERYAGMRVERLKELDIKELDKHDAYYIALDYAPRKKGVFLGVGEEAGDEKLDIRAKEWLKKEIIKQFDRRGGWCSFVTEEMGFLFLRADNAVFNGKTVAKIAQAWGENICGGNG